MLLLIKNPRRVGLVVTVLAGWSVVQFLLDVNGISHANLLFLRTAGPTILPPRQMTTSIKLAENDDHNSNNHTKQHAAFVLSTEEQLAASFTVRTPRPFWPDLALARYQEQHAAQIVQSEDNKQSLLSRQYAVAYYWCPDRAGNVLHNLFWSISWAIIHNRTLIVEYVEPSLAYNTVEDCRQVMQLQDWILTMDDYQLLMKKHGLPTTPFIVPVPLDSSRTQYDLQHDVVVFPQIRDMERLLIPLLSSNTTTTPRVPQLFFQEWSTDPWAYQSYLKTVPKSMQSTVGMLYYHGRDYCIGMLMRHTVVNLLEGNVVTDGSVDRLEDVVVDDNNNNDDDGDSISIALHSRHPVLGDDGSFIIQEQACILEVLQTLAASSNTTKPRDCKIYLMSDRPLTLERLSEWLVTHPEANSWLPCTPVVAANHAHTQLRVTEHGPWAGQGYWQDLALASRARTAVIGDPRRSSYMLFKAAIVYERHYQAYLKQEKQTELPECELPNRSWRGYHYNPTDDTKVRDKTPMFVHYSMAEPLVPIQMLKNYKIQTTKTDGQKKYAIVYYACPINGQGNGLERFFTDFVLAVLSGRIMIVQYWDYETCVRLGGQGCDHNMYDRESCNNLLAQNSWDNGLISDSGNVISDQDALLSESLTLRQLEETTDWQQRDVVVFPSMSRLELHNLALGDTVAAKDFKAMTLQLLEQGSDFLYGLVFHYAFQLQPVVKVDLFPSGFPDAPIEFDTFALSGMETDAGALACVKRVCRPSSDYPCHVFASEGWSQELATEADIFIWEPLETVENVNTSYDQSLAFLRGQFFASQARSGYIGDGPSSLGLDWIEYKRRLEVWKLGRIPPRLPHFSRCGSPSAASSY